MIAHTPPEVLEALAQRDTTIARQGARLIEVGVRLLQLDTALEASGRRLGALRDSVRDAGPILCPSAPGVPVVNLGGRWSLGLTVGPGLVATPRGQVYAGLGVSVGISYKFDVARWLGLRKGGH